MSAISVARGGYVEAGLRSLRDRERGLKSDITIAMRHGDGPAERNLRVALHAIEEEIAFLSGPGLDDAA